MKMKSSRKSKSRELFVRTLLNIVLFANNQFIISYTAFYSFRLFRKAMVCGTCLLQRGLSSSIK